MIEDHIPFDPAFLKQKASGYKKQHKKLFKKLKGLPSSTIDRPINALHYKYMENYDCLACGNCCKSISPAINDRDVDRIAHQLRVKPSEVVAKYLFLDEDGDFVFRTQPCPFLGGDNYCSIYDSRPRACREYPHTDRAKQYQILNLTFKNISVCPVVYEVVQELSEEMK